MKRLLTFLLTLGLLFTLSSPVFASSDVKINANGNILKDAQAVIQNSSTLLPVRSVSNAFGCEVDWNGDTKTVSVNKGDTQITIVIGQKELTVNDTKQSISAPAQIINGRTYVPLRALGEALDCEIHWVNDTRTVEITPNDPAEYKAWYEVDENGNLYIKTNISSRKWDGYTIINKVNYNSRNWDWDSDYGTGIVQCQARGFYSHFPVNTMIHSTEFYVCKGILKNVSDSGGDPAKVLSSVSDKIVYKVTLDNTITIKDSGKTINISSFQMTNDSNKNKEIYTLTISNKLSNTGLYDLHYAFGTKIVCGSGLKIKDGALQSHLESGFYPIDEKGYFSISHSIYSMDASGNITLSKTTSNSIDSTTLQ